MNRKQWIAVGSASVLGLGIFSTGAVATASTLRFDDVPGQRLDLEGVQPAGASTPATGERPASASGPSASPTTEPTDPAATQVPSVVEPEPAPAQPAPAQPAPAQPAPAQPAPAPAPQHVSADSPVTAASPASAD
ncbi:hypothetical protein [Arenivirga flava]|uniref:Uncharacterized protein n=1 Tax=Arenivirga flava TaxID=1930060 RepID=A0AA37UL21_9MICO|nr:hypothetical protein [Arenivirga flava]GMA26991.1 hypothetical protein GCM10025874_02440 [Arenivirga flava]